MDLPEKACDELEKIQDTLKKLNELGHILLKHKMQLKKFASSVYLIINVQIIVIFVRWSIFC